MCCLQGAQYAQRLRGDRGQVTISFVEQGEEDDLTAEEREVSIFLYFLFAHTSQYCLPN